MEVNIILRVQTWRPQFDPRIYIRVYRENHSAKLSSDFHTYSGSLHPCKHMYACNNNKYNLKTNLEGALI